MKNTKHSRQMVSFGYRSFRNVFRCPARVNGRALLLFMRANWSKIVGRSASGLGATLVMCGSLPRADAAVVANYTFQASNGASSDADTGSVAGTFGAVGLTPGFETGPFTGATISTFATANDLPTAQTTVNYFTFTITPTAGNRLNLSGAAALTFDYSRNTGLDAFNWAVRSSVDGFATDIATGTTPTANTLLQASVNLSTAFNFQDAAVEFRFFAWDGGDNGASAHGYFDNVVLNATVVPVPEPINAALAIFGLCLAGVGVGRRFLRARG